VQYIIFTFEGVSSKTTNFDNVHTTLTYFISNILVLFLYKKIYYKVATGAHGPPGLSVLYRVEEELKQEPACVTTLLPPLVVQTVQVQGQNFKHAIPKLAMGPSVRIFHCPFSFPNR